MCGIVGIVDFGNPSDRKAIVEKMLTAIAYRGPDGSGIFNSPFATLGNVRLSIIDIEGGHQPLSDSTERYWIVYNGEIFNYPELRKRLISKGCVFKTLSDTEVLVQLYANYGSKCLPMLNGQFAFAIWDKLNEELFLARDRVGIRPLFYNLSNGTFSFASEIKCLFQQEGVSPQFRNESLLQVYTFWTSLTPNTVFKDIYELSPGEYLIYSRRGVRKQKYWELDFSHPDCSITLPDAMDQFHELFTDSVRLRLRADVDVAAYLSGGLDSSTSVAYIKKIEPDVLNTFSVKFEEEDFDESGFQSEAVQYLNTSHKSITCSSGDIGESFPRVVWHCETPLMRTAPAPMLMLSKLVRDNNIKVVITGEGADEMLAGYNIFKETMIRKFWAVDPDSSIRPLLLKKLYPYLPQMKQANPHILKMFFGYKLQDVDNPFYSHLLRWNNSNHITRHLSDDFRQSIHDYSPFEELTQNLPRDFNGWDSLAKAQWLETTMFMSGYLLSSQGDRMAMANSVESRYPFLDYRLLEFCASLPSKFKLNGLNEKYMLKRIAGNKIPESIVNRAKQAYRAPITSVFLSDHQNEQFREMFSRTSFESAGVFNPNSVDAILEKIRKQSTATEVENMLLTFVSSTHILAEQFIHQKARPMQQMQLTNLKVINDFKNPPNGN